MQVATSIINALTEAWDNKEIRAFGPDGRYGLVEIEYEFPDGLRNEVINAMREAAAEDAEYRKENGIALDSDDPHATGGKWHRAANRLAWVCDELYRIRGDWQHKALMHAMEGVNE